MSNFLKSKEMHERLRKLLREWNRTDAIVKECIEWVEIIVNSDEHRLVSMLSSVCHVLRLTVQFTYSNHLLGLVLTRWS